jgi:arylsulfatase A-like enzyme
MDALALADEPRPNVVFFLIDDLGRADCGFMGGREIRTPNIDKLAAAGAKLDAFYAQPVCSPTRAALLTGRYPMRYGLQVGVVKPWAQYGLPLEERTLAEDLQSAGYATGIFGKWHLGHFAPAYLPTRRGFDRQYGHYNGAIDYFTHERDGGFDWHEDDKVCRDEGYSTTLIGERSARFVEENAGKRPFFLYVPFNAVHSPHQVPDEYTAEYSELSGRRRKYAGMLTSVDDAIGAIVGAVDKAGARGNTLFVFSSDNGGPAPGRVTDNGKFRGAKGGLYEGGVRVAAFATWEGRIPAGRTVDAALHMVDWRPTLGKLCGVQAAEGPPLDGIDIWPTIVGSGQARQRVILLNAAPREGAVRDGDWKLIVRASGATANRKRNRKRGTEAVELFNLRNDPYETTNLAEDKPEKVNELRQVLDRLNAEAAPPKAGPQPDTFVSPAIWGEAG